MLIFGIILNDKTMILVNLFGTAINICYLSVFYIHTNEVDGKARVWTQLGYAGAFLMAIFGYTNVENPEVLLFRYGILVTVVIFGFVGLPLFSLVRQYFLTFFYPTSRNYPIFIHHHNICVYFILIIILE